MVERTDRIVTEEGAFSPRTKPNCIKKTQPKQRKDAGK